MEGEPERKHGSADPYWLEPPSGDDDHLAVAIRYVRNLLARPLLLLDLKSDPAVKDKYLLDGFQGASMPLEEATFERIAALAGLESSHFDAMLPEPVNSDEALEELERKYADALPQIKEAVSRRIERGPVAAAVKEATGYIAARCATPLD